MATTLSDLIVKLSLDNSKFTKGIRQSTTSLTALQKKFTSGKTGITDFAKVTEALQGKQTALSQKFQLQTTRLDKLKQEYKEVVEAEGADSEAAQRLAVQIGTLENGMKSLQGKIQKVNKDIDLNSNRFYQLGANMQGVGTKIQSAGTSIAGVGAALTKRVTAPILAVGTAAVKTTADFDSAMSEVAAVSGASGSQFDALRQKAVEMGAKTKFSATEAAQAMLYMGMAGWDASETMDGLEGVMNAAAASGEDLAQVSDIITDGLTAFGMSASESTYMADVLTATATSANTTITGLGETFKYAGAVAGSMGIDLEDAALATGLMANASVKAGMAGTSLRSGLANLIHPSKTVAEAMEQYNVHLVKNKDGTADLTGTIKLLRERLGGLSKTEQTAALSAIFGKDAMTGWAAIVSTSDKDFNKLADSIANADGSAEEIANLKLDNLSGQLTILKSTLESIAIQIGTIITPAVSAFVEKAQSMATAFENMDDGTKKTIVTIAGVAAAVGPVIAIIGKLVAMVGGAISAVGGIMAAAAAGEGVVAAVGAALGALAGPIAIVVALVAAAAIAIVTHWDQIKQKAGELASGVAEKFNAFKEAATGVFTTIGDALSGFAETVASVFTTIGQAVQVGVMLIGSIIGAAVTIITLPWQFVWQNVKDIVLPVLTEVGSAISTAFQTAASVVSGAVSTVYLAVSSAFSGVAAAVCGPVNAARSAVSGAFTAISSKIGATTSAARAKVSGGFQAIKTAISEPVNAAKVAVSRAFTAIGTKISTTINKAKSVVQNGLNTIKGFFANLRLKFPNIKLPHFSITGSFSLDPPSVPHLSVKWYKNGAIFARPTLFNTAAGVKGVGEAGPEAVAPISTLLGYVQDAVTAVYSGMVDVIQQTLANGINAIVSAQQMRSGGGTKIIRIDIMAGTKVLAQALYDPLKDVAVQRGEPGYA